jgi:cell wall-associated NlpC family hydrolase
MMSPSQIEAMRPRVVEIAKQWLNTPYHPEARIKGAGADCAMMPLMVYKEAGIIKVIPEVPHYPVDWAVHNNTPVYTDLVERVVRDNGLCEVAPPPEREPLPGDFLLFHFAHAYSHGAIVTAWPLCIHAHIRCGIVYVDALQNPALAQKIADGVVKCFSFGHAPAAGSAALPSAGGLDVR